MELFSLEGKVAIVTGGGSGIGKSIAERFLMQGARVHVLELSPQNADLEADGDLVIHQCDVSNGQQVATVVDEIFLGSGAVDILVNNAGIAHIGNAEQTVEEDLDKLYQVNIKGVYNCVRAVVPKMKKVGAGVILNMASIAASVGINNRFAYSMTKGAVLAMTYSIAKDYLPDNIRCNSISPARIHTPFVDGFISKNYQGKENEMFQTLSKTQPIGRMGKPEEVASMAVYLCSNEASFITGTDFPIDGGFIKLNGN